MTGTALPFRLPPVSPIRCPDMSSATLPPQSPQAKSRQAKSRSPRPVAATGQIRLHTRTYLQKLREDRQDRRASRKAVLEGPKAARPKAITAGPRAQVPNRKEPPLSPNDYSPAHISQDAAAPEGRRESRFAQLLAGEGGKQETPQAEPSHQTAAFPDDPAPETGAQAISDRKSASLHRLPGIGPGMVHRLNQLGIATLNDMAAADIDQLIPKLGAVAALVRLDVWRDFARAECGLDAA